MEEGIEVEGERYEMVDIFCYLGDMIGRKGGVDAAVTARIRSAWAKFRELSPFLTAKATPRQLKGQVYTACVRSCMTYGSETWATKEEHCEKMERAEMRMIRWMCGVSLSENRPSAELKQWLGVTSICEVVRRNRLRWYGHVERKESTDWIKKCSRFTVAGTVPPGRPRKTWISTVEQDMRTLGIHHSDTQDRVKWRPLERHGHTHCPKTG